MLYFKFPIFNNFTFFILIRQN